MCNFQKFLNQLNDGFVFEFEYMGKQHKVASFDKATYTITKYTNDNKSEREERKIINKFALKELFKGMSNITYLY